MNIYRFAIRTCLRLLAGLALVSAAIPAAAVPARAASGSIIYVDWKAGGAGNGTSWKDAYPGLQSGFLNASSGMQVWVAAGTYKPAGLYGTDRTNTFTLKSGVQVYGGFNGSETQLSQRRPRTNITILSGELYDTSVITDNSFHVVTASGADKT